MTGLENAVHLSRPGAGRGSDTQPYHSVPRACGLVIAPAARDPGPPAGARAGMGLCALLWAFTASASPVGTEFGVFLGGAVVQGGQVENESKLGFVPFDDAADPLPVDLDPAQVSGAFRPGTGLVITERAGAGPGGMDTIEIWIAGQAPGDPAPTPGAPLFANPVYPGESVSFSIEDLLWGDATPAARVQVVDLSLGSVPGGAQSLSPLLIDIVGRGTEDDPLFVDLELAASEFEGATDLHLTLGVTPVPVPAALPLFAAGLAVFGVLCGPRRRHRSDLDS